jgi:hypothetical protein
MSSRSSGVTNVRLSLWMNLVRQEVALVLDLLDLVGLVPDRVLGVEHLLEHPRAVLQLGSQRLEIGVELLFARNQSKRHRREKCSRSVYTRSLHAKGL